MAGHSHAKNIKRKKEATDKKKSTAFSKISRLIIATVREKGKDPEKNPSLRSVIEKAKEADMPKENIERAIKRGAGEGEEGALSPFLFEAYGPKDLALIIEGYTDNRNRTFSQIKEIIKKNNGKIADPGSVKWLFDQKGIIELDKDNINEDISLKLIEKGVEDIQEKENFIILYTSLNKIEEIKSFLESQKIKINSSLPGWKPKTRIGKNDNYNNIVNELLQNDSVEEVYSNI